MKGIILAGGAGTRLYPLTLVTSKQLLPVYNKPMIYYPLSTLMLAEIRDILIISTPEDTTRMRNLLGDGSHFGIKLSYAIQSSPDGLAQAFLIAEDFIGNESSVMILGDNIFYGNGLGNRLKKAVGDADNGVATIFGYYVEEPKRFGIVEFEKKNRKENRVISLEEKPQKPKSNYAIVGLYFYPKGVSEKAKLVRPSDRGELEITSLNELYLQEDKLNVQLLGKGFSWMDAGTIDSLSEASEFVRVVEKRQGTIIGAPEEIAFRYHWIDQDTLLKSARKYGKSPYGKYLSQVGEGKIL